MKENKVLKILSYISLPILIGIIIVSMIYTFAKDSYSNYIEYSYDSMDQEAELINNSIYKEEAAVNDSIYKKEEIILNNYDRFILEILEKTEEKEDALYSAIPVSSVLILVITTYLIISIGHTKGKEGIDTNDLDKVPLEILITFVIVITSIISVILINFDYWIIEQYPKLMVSLSVTAYLIIYTLLAILTTTTIKRIKAKTLARTTIIGLIWIKLTAIVRNINNKIENGLNTFIDSRKNVTRLIFLIIFYILIIIMTIPMYDTDIVFFPFVIDVAVTIYAFYLVVKRINCFEKIEKQLKKIYEGNNKEKLNEDEFTKEFQNAVKYINDISNGFENAVEEGIKSERLKTELITNVSHDIKTPLTSIINYVDLLKQENIEGEKAKEYIEILESKSHRLKRLTEDLIEASKASSGNVKLNLEKINIGELINQTTGEYEDRFKEKGLEIITQIPEKDVFIRADSRYMYRIIENIFSNISKYAAKDTRVYIDILEDSGRVRIAIKNISAERLNISAEELTQRFVRGDKSRTTEGSGLGLAISRDLTELQKGKFEIQIDGDLFKIELEFETI